MSAALHTVHVRVNDAETGQPTPVRIRFTDANGFYYAPFGRLTCFSHRPNEDVGGNVTVNGLNYAYIGGMCEIELPSGELIVEVEKGPEYRPLRRAVTLGIGQKALRFTIERWLDLRKEGWYSGDTHAEFLTPHAALLEAAAEDLAIVNLLARWTQIVSSGVSMAHDAETGEKLLPEHGSVPYPAIPNILAFSGQRPALEMPGHMVVVNTLNQHPVLGTLGLLNCHRPVYPLACGGALGWDDWSLAAWCDQCHRKKGLVVWAHAWNKETGFKAGEALADLILGKVDALEIAAIDEAYAETIEEWYRLLNCGFRVPLVGASGKNSNNQVLGGLRTYARLQPGEEFNYQNWIEAIRAGRTMVTNGPVLTLTVEGHDAGSVLEPPASISVIHVQAEARSTLPVQRLEIIKNGETVASTTAATLEADVAVPESGWIAARCEGPPTAPTSQPQAAHTAPIYLVRGGRPVLADQEIVAAFAAHLDRTLDWVGEKERVENEARREHLAGVFQAARNELLRRGKTLP